MINHVVLFKLKEFETPEAKLEVITTFKSKLLALYEKISELQFVSVGLNYQLNAASFDVCLQTHFENLEDLETYRVHEDHVEVVQYIADFVESRAAVDYPF